MYMNTGSHPPWLIHMEVLSLVLEFSPCLEAALVTFAVVKADP